MKNLIRGTISIALVSIVLAFPAHSSPPLQERFDTFKQSDGAEVVLLRYGDARFHWLETRAGEVVVKNPDTGDYEYAAIKKENGKPKLVPSGIRVEQGEKKRSSASATAEERLTPVTRKDLIPLRKAAKKNFQKVKPNEVNR